MAKPRKAPTAAPNGASAPASAPDREPVGGSPAAVPAALVDGPAAFGAPGAEPTWAHGSKQAVGTSLTRESPVWFTIAEGVLTEVYYPRVDLANTRDLQFLLVGRGPDEFFEERRDTLAEVRPVDPRSLAWRVTNTERQGRFVIDKRVLTD